MVLDVSDQNQIKVIQVPEGMRERYICLSYCWGEGPQTIMLNKTNQSDLTSGVGLRQLDPTIRDSVTVARQLGFKFLWIDALCILQDDHALKARELGRMGDIYRNATLTIVASAAGGVRRGFLGSRMSTLERVALEAGRADCVFKTTAEGENGDAVGTSPVILRPEVRYVWEPWYERAWTFQEMLFSGRRLQYHFNQTTWTCSCSETTAQQNDGWVSRDKHIEENYNEGKVLEDTMAILKGGHGLAPGSSVLSTWYSLVEAYSARKLTYHTDRLPAIAGIAKEFASVLGDQYLCGLWKSDLTLGLVWSSTSADESCLWSLEHASGSRPEPSWSWVSCGSKILFPYRYRNDDWRESEEFEILGSSVDLVLANQPFGEVKTAKLHIRGLLRLLPTESADSSCGTEPRLDAEFLNSVVFDYHGYLTAHQGSGVRLWGLLVIVNGDRSQMAGIVVREEKEKQYSRVGHFEVQLPVPPKFQLHGHEMRLNPVPEFSESVRLFWGEDVREIVLV